MKRWQLLSIIGALAVWAFLTVATWGAEKFLDRNLEWLLGPSVVIPVLLAFAGLGWVAWRHEGKRRELANRGAFLVFKAAQDLQPEDLSFQRIEDINQLKPGFRPFYDAYVERVAISRSDLGHVDTGGDSPPAATRWTERALVEELRAGRNVLLIGKPIEGKTRTMFEVVRLLTVWMVVIPDPAKVQPADDAFTLVEGLDVVCLIDDLSNFVGKPVDLPAFCALAARHAHRFVIAATCRDGPEFGALAEAYESPQRRLLETLAHRLCLQPASEADKRKLRAAVPPGGDTVSTTLGSICMRGAFAAMLLRFDTFDRPTQDCHRAIQLLAVAGVRGLTVQRIQTAWSALWNRSDGDAALRDSLAHLRRSGFLLSEERVEAVIPEMAYYGAEEAGVFYREGALAPSGHAQDDIPRLVDLLVEHGDHAAVYEIASADIEAERWDSALSLLDRIKLVGGDLPGAMVGYARAWVLDRTGRHQESIDAYQEMVCRLAASSDASVRELVAKAMFNVGVTLDSMARAEEAVAIYDKLLLRLAHEREPLYDEHVAKALVNKGGGLRRLGRFQEAITAVDEVLERFGDATEAALCHQVAKALGCKSDALQALGHDEEKIAVCDDVSKRFGNSTDASLRGSVATALLNKSTGLLKLERFSEVITTCDRLERCFGGEVDAKLCGVVLQALGNRGLALSKLGREADAVAVWDDIVRRSGDAPTQPLREAVANALVGKGASIAASGRLEEAVAVFDQVISRFGALNDDGARAASARALFNKGYTRGRLGHSQEAISIYDEVVSRFGGSSDVAQCEAVASALLDKACKLATLERWSEEIAAYDEIVRLFGDSEEAALRDVVAKALLNKGIRLGVLERCQEEILVCDDIERRFAKSNRPTLSKCVARALLNRVISLDRVWPFADTVALVEDVVDRFGDSADPDSSERSR